MRNSKKGMEIFQVNVNLVEHMKIMPTLHKQKLEIRHLALLVKKLDKKDRVKRKFYFHSLLFEIKIK